MRSDRGRAGGPTISLCMIVKNEEKNLPDCIGPITNLVDEIIVVDTGSTDRTKEVAAQLGARVFDFGWVDSFAAARNESKRRATGDWIFWLDADDRIDEANRQRLRELFASLQDELAAYLVRIDVMPSAPKDPIRVVHHARLVRNHPKVRWHYRVHEQILPTVIAAGGKIHRTDLVIRHVGYQDASLKGPKLERNLRLMKLDDHEHPNDPFILYNLGRAYERLDRIAESLPYWKRSLKHAPAGETYVRKLYSLLAQGHLKIGRPADAFQSCLGGLARFPEDPELLFLVGSILFEQGDADAAESCLTRLLALPPATHMALGDDPGLATYKARHMLARINHDKKKHAAAEKLWRSVLAEQSGFVQGWLGLGQTYVELKNWPALNKVIDKLESLADGGVAAAVLRGLRHAVQKDWATARKLMEETIAQNPKAIEPRILLSRLCMRDRRSDPSAAERAVRGVLELDPNNAEAQRQLEKLADKPVAASNAVATGAVQ
jgi:glycosyltransferase involved in cell wall biosynthesis